MLNKNLTKIDFENRLQNVIDDNLLVQVTINNITQIREEFRKIILEAQQFDIDILDMFPIIIKYSYEYAFNFNYNGSVFLIKPNHTIMIFNNYGSDSICQDK